MRIGLPSIALVVVVALPLAQACGGKVIDKESATGGAAGKSPGTGGYHPGQGGKGGADYFGGSGGWAQGGSGGYGWGGWGGYDGAPSWGGSGGAAGSSKLGAKCKAATDCGSELTCIASMSTDFLGGWPAAGYCTAECTNDANVCTSFGGTCVDMAPNGGYGKSFCMQSCTIGPPIDMLDGKLDPQKCWGRNTVACTEVDGGKAVCMPTCQRDEQCGQAWCDPKTGMCTVSPHQGLPFGSGCRQWGLSGGDAGVDCAGTCMAVQKTDQGSATDPKNIAYLCSQHCVANDFSGCGFAESVPTGACIYLWAETGAGDQASCMPMCDIDSDCIDQQENNGWCDTSFIDQGWPRGFCMYKYGP
jgi:hypothetical protein